MKNAKQIIKQLEKKVVFSNEFITLRNDKVRFPNGKTSNYAVVESNNFCGTLCITKKKKLVLVRLYRYPWLKSSWEISSGFIDPGETPLEAATREVKEETGYDIINIEPMLNYFPMGNNSTIGYLFFAQVEKSDATFDINEIEEVKEFTTTEFEKLVERNVIFHGTTLLAYYYIKDKGFL